MKKSYYILSLLLCLSIGFYSCDDILDAPAKSTLDDESIFSNPELAKGALGGILQSFAETNSHRSRYLVYYGINTDCEVNNSIKNIINDKQRLANYNTNISNDQMNHKDNIWAMLYQGIERANLAIRGLRTFGDVENNPELAQILGETITLRAVLYSELLKAWGDVPARFEPINSKTLYLPKSDRDVIYKQLLIDLEEAAGLVAWPNETAATTSTERVNKAFVKGLRARLALAAGGYSQRADGTIRRSLDPDLAPEKMYEIVKSECLDIIEGEGAGTCRLETFEEVFKSLHKETLQAGLESLWEIPFSDGRGRVIFDLGVKHTNTDKYTGQAKGGTNGPNPIMYYEYNVDDVRRDITCIPYEWTNGKQVPTNLNKWYFGKYRYEWLSRRVTSDNDDGLNWLYMRYSDVILMAAEAINELDGPDVAAPYLRMVRERAFPNNPEKVDAFMVQVTEDRDVFFNAIVDERALEFTGEMLRKGDLIRWNMLGSKLAEAKAKLQRLENREGEYADLPEKVYYKMAEDEETVIIYGLNRGETDAIGSTMEGYDSKTWKLSSNDEAVTYWDALYLRNPDSQQFWPIWQIFINASNGTLNNDGYNVP